MNTDRYDVHHQTVEVEFGLLTPTGEGKNFGGSDGRASVSVDQVIEKTVRALNIIVVKNGVGKTTVDFLAMASSPLEPDFTVQGSAPCQFLFHRGFSFFSSKLLRFVMG